MTLPTNTVTPVQQLNGEKAGQQTEQEEPGKNKKGSLFDKFARSTDMHGFIQIAEAKSLPERAFWIVALVVCIGFLLYTSYLIIRAEFTAEYQSNISAEPDTRMPVLEFCPMYWLSREKAKEKGHDDWFFVGVSCLVAENLADPVWCSKVKPWFEEIRKELLAWPGTVESFLLSLAFDFDKMIKLRDPTGRFTVVENYTKIRFPYGACYVLNVDNRPPILTPLSMEIYLPNISSEAMVNPEQSTRVYFQMNDQTFGDPFGGPESLTPLSTELSYQMRYSKIQIEYINRESKPCANGLGAENGESYMKCKTTCELKFCIENDLKPPFMDGYDFTFHEIALAGDEHQCRPVYQGFQDATKGEMDNCENRCLLPCKRMLFNFSPSLTDIISNANATTWTVVVEQGKTKFKMEETHHSELLNGISGMLSLWLGASVLSLVHVVAFFFNCK